MKKLLAIIVMGLLWSNSSYSYVMQDLIKTLEETKKPKSIEVAETLKSINTKEKSYDLIIRKANLNLKDAKNIANAISRVENNNGPKLHTLSMSFNQESLTGWIMGWSGACTFPIVKPVLDDANARKA